MAAHTFTDNTELIIAMRTLGYLRDEWLTLDPTYGKGNWWKRWEPHRLIRHSREMNGDGFDFRKMEYDDDTFDAIAFDPPYVCPGGRKTSTLRDFQPRYGLDRADEFRNPAELQSIICDGLTEMRRLVRPAVKRGKDGGGIILVKCQDYVWGGALWEGTFHTRMHAHSLGLVCLDRIEHITPKQRPQPRNRSRKNRDGTRTPTTQQHAARNLSTLFVFQKPKPRRNS
jgi:hypothetical protein